MDYSGAEALQPSSSVQVPVNLSIVPCICHWRASSLIASASRSHAGQGHARSLLELEPLWLADPFDPTVAQLATPPFQLAGGDIDAPHRHVPDILLVHRDRQATIADMQLQTSLSHPRSRRSSTGPAASVVRQAVAKKSSPGGTHRSPSYRRLGRCATLIASKEWPTGTGTDSPAAPTPSTTAE